MFDQEALLTKYRGYTYDALANAAIRLEKVIQRDTDIGAATCVNMNRNYLRLMDQVLREKEHANRRETAP